MRSQTVAFLALFVAVASSVSGEETQGRILFSVTVDQTGEPVPGTRLNASLGLTESTETTAKRVTDSRGMYELAVPWGNVRLYTPTPPVGYWIARKSFDRFTAFEQLVVTRDEPRVSRSFVFQQGVVWPVEVQTEGGKAIAGGHLHCINSKNGSIGGGTTTNAAGVGQVTLPADGGEVDVRCRFQPLLTALPRKVTLQIAPDFDHQNVVRQARAPGGDRIEVFDHKGSKVSCEGCSIVIRDRRAKLVLTVPEPAGASMAGEVIGRVVDETGKGVKDATILYSGHGVAEDEYLRKTDAEGAFQIRGLLKFSPPGELPGFSILANQTGYVGAQVKHLFAPNESGTMRLQDPIVLRPAHSVRLQVLSEEGMPVEGAWAECNLISPIIQIPKTDQSGFCTLQNLPEGKTVVRLSYGDQTGVANVEVGPASNAAEPLIARLKKRSEGPAVSYRTRPHVKRLAVGKSAPEWNVREWTDGKTHSLAAHRGKVVVLEFWDMGCGQCKAITMPVSNAMQPKFAKDVVFVHIHPATEDVNIVREWLTAQRWNMIAGFDAGTGPTDSETLKRYGVDGFPAIFIVDRKGRVVDNGENAATQEAEMAKRKALAEEAGLPWPLDKDASDEEHLRRLRLFHEHWMTKKIQAALGSE
jgi:thiol-disulfide isomerase/thioredoxin